MEGPQKFKKISKINYFFRKIFFQKYFFRAQNFFKNRAISKKYFPKLFFQKMHFWTFFKKWKFYFFPKFSRRLKNAFLENIFARDFNPRFYAVCIVHYCPERFPILNSQKATKTCMIATTRTPVAGTRGVRGVRTSCARAKSACAKFKSGPRKTWTHPDPEKVRSEQREMKIARIVHFQKWQTPITIQFYFQFWKKVPKRASGAFFFARKWQKNFCARKKLFFKNVQNQNIFSKMKFFCSFENPFYFPCIFLHFREKKIFSEKCFFQSSKTTKKMQNFFKNIFQKKVQKYFFLCNFIKTKTDGVEAGHKKFWTNWK